MKRKSSLLFLLSVLFTISPLAWAAGHMHHAGAQSTESDQYLETVSELTARARANVYFINPQSPFRGVQVNFVNVGSGNLTFLRRDIVTSGAIPLVFARVYDSSGAGSVDLGPGWTISAAEEISVGDRTAVLRGENGDTIVFARNGARLVLAKSYPSDYLDVAMTAEDVITARLQTGFTKEFRRIGDRYRLARVFDRSGNEVRLLYASDLLSRIENGTHSLDIGRNAAGRVVTVTDDQKRQARFSYDAQGRLVEVDDLGGHAWKYEYGAGGMLKAAVDPLGKTTFAPDYDAEGRVKRLALPSGAVRYVYDAIGRVTRVADRRQLSSRYFQNADGITTRVVNALGEETSIALDDTNSVIALTRNGKTAETMEYDAQHRLVTRHSYTAGGVVDTRYDYDPLSGRLRSVASSAQSKTFTYDDDGNLLTAALPDGVHQYRHERGLLIGLTTPQADLVFTRDADGMIASMQQGEAVTAFEHNAGGELTATTFANGQSAAYAYGASGLRQSLTYDNGAKVRYRYDPAGNLAGTEIFDATGEQVHGQRLIMDDSYRLVRWIPFQQPETDFTYDPNGNLTEMRQGRSVTRLVYDALNRLVAVITPAGKRYTYTYKPGERSEVEGYEHSSVLAAERRDTGLTFAHADEVLATRPVLGNFGAVRFSENLGTFQLANGDGTEIITPETLLEESLEKQALVSDDGAPLQNRQNSFHRPFNSLFMPAEYATINCCPLCRFGSEISCANCDGGLGPQPHLDNIAPSQAGINDSPVQVSIFGAFNGGITRVNVNPQTGTTGTVTATVNSKTVDTIIATLNLSQAGVGKYSVTVSDSGGGSDNSVTFTVLPSIESLDPGLGTVGTPTQVTIGGAGFIAGSTSVDAGPKIAVSNVSVSRSTQLTATFTPVNAATSEGDQPVKVIVSGQTTDSSIAFTVQIPRVLVRMNVAGAPGGVGPLMIVPPGDVIDLNGNHVRTNRCGMYRNYAFDIEDGHSFTINASYTFNEKFSNYTTSVPGLTIPPNQSFNSSGNGEVTDLQLFSTILPDCPGSNDHESYDMTFSVTIGGVEYPLSTVQHINRGNYNGTATVDATISTP